MACSKTALRTLSTLASFFSVPALAFAQEALPSTETIRDTGVSALWILANVSYAGMRAQNHRSWIWRFIAFVFGFPGTLISWMAVGEGTGRAYGIDIPARPGSPWVS